VTEPNRTRTFIVGFDSHLYYIQRLKVYRYKEMRHRLSNYTTNYCLDDYKRKRSLAMAGGL